ncbi:MAG TPA: ectoine synthase [Bacillus bacterium]|uniref:L-ectoine synthase n=1 Tax=Siminovitchia fordii TaxID=254759 RepID=A0ABQ4K743_9BACI|nr:ectoine synthase [Siminovitchia fordii]GIN21552.1 L-ectoine synthase [Siminovitchia fordii]HBZ09840.1 ectoine synthase [Bacillus sp. (in: firmicutes)]
MIVRTLEEVIGTENEVKADNWVSRRLLLKDDNMGFSYHDTIIYAGTETHIWYKNHLEAVYCVAGEGEIETISDGKVYPIKDGTMYALDKNDEHYLRATKDMRMICVFNPPLTGRETHDEEGVYPLVED